MYAGAHLRVMQVLRQNTVASTVAQHRAATETFEQILEQYNIEVSEKFDKIGFREVSFDVNPSAKRK